MPPSLLSNDIAVNLPFFLQSLKDPRIRVCCKTKYSDWKLALNENIQTTFDNHLKPSIDNFCRDFLISRLADLGIQQYSDLPQEMKDPFTTAVEKGTEVYRKHFFNNETHTESWIHTCSKLMSDHTKMLIQFVPTGVNIGRSESEQNRFNSCHLQRMRKQFRAYETLQSMEGSRLYVSLLLKEQPQLFHLEDSMASVFIPPLDESMIEKLAKLQKDADSLLDLPKEKSLSEEALESLIAELEGSAASGKQKPKEKARASKKSQENPKKIAQSSDSFEASACAAEPEDTPSSSPTLNFHQDLIQAFKISPYELAPRVIRWRKTKDLNDIRKFKDTHPHTGERILTYSAYSKKQLEQMRDYHDLMEVSFLLAFDSEKYFFPTTKGKACFATLQIGEQRQEGIVYLGIGKEDNVIYHLMFSPVNFSDHNKTFTILQDTSQSVGLEETDSAEEKWQFANKQCGIERERNGNVTISYENKVLTILPLH